MSSERLHHTTIALLCLTAALVALPAAIRQPGLPVILKSDEPAYYLAALSLGHDGDLRCDEGDLRRLFEEFPHPTKNLILMSDDGWENAYYSKPLIYSLLAAPAALLLGASGILTFNMLLFVAMIWMAAVQLKQYNPWPIAAIYSVAFLLLSGAFPYVFWIHTEIFNMTAVMAAFFFAMHGGRVGAQTGPWPALASGCALALGTYNKPMLIFLALPLLFSVLRGAVPGQVRPWLIGFALTGAACAGLAILLTGHPTPYLGVERRGFNIDRPDTDIRNQLEPRVSRAPNQGSWGWASELPEVRARGLVEVARSFLLGRHVGILVYLPFAGVSVLLCLLHSRRSTFHYLLMASLAAIALCLVIWIPFNWHGGGGFIGNRYYVNVYPAFLFLVSEIRLRKLLVLACGWSGFVLGPLLMSALGVPVAYPTLQAHTRNRPFDLFPLERDLMTSLPDYWGARLGGVGFWGRKDVFRPSGDDLLVHGGLNVEIAVRSDRPIRAAAFEVRSLAPTNDVVVRFGSARRQVSMSGEQPVRIELAPEAPLPRTWFGHDDDYLLQVYAKRGELLDVASADGQEMAYLGVAITYLGTTDELATDVALLGWGDCSLPDRVGVGEPFEVVTSVTNRSRGRWIRDGATRVQRSYHWLSDDERVVEWDGARSALSEDVAPGGTLRVAQTVVAPSTPGCYILVMDLVRERVSWFSERNGNESCRGLVRVE